MLNGQTKSRGASIQSRISPNSERSVSDVGGSGLLALGSLKAITQAANGGDPDAARLDFLAQPMDVDFDGVVADFFAPAAEMVDQLVLADQAAHAAEQDFEQADFAGRQFERLPIDLGDATDLIVAQRATDDGRRRAGGTPGQRPDAGFEFGQLERFDHVVVGAEVEALDAVAGAVERGQDQHRQLRVARPQALENLQAGEFGQTEIEDQQIVGSRRQCRIGLQSVRRPIHRVSPVAERAGKAIGDDAVVFSDKDAHIRLPVRRKIFVSLPHYSVRAVLLLWSSESRFQRDSGGGPILHWATPYRFFPAKLTQSSKKSGLRFPQRIGTR